MKCSLMLVSLCNHPTTNNFKQSKRYPVHVVHLGFGTWGRTRSSSNRGLKTAKRTVVFGAFGKALVRVCPKIGELQRQRFPLGFPLNHSPEKEVLYKQMHRCEFGHTSRPVLLSLALRDQPSCLGPTPSFLGWSQQNDRRKSHHPQARQ